MEQAYNHHVSVMLDEVIEYANLKKNSKVLDMTLGRAGHSSEFLKRIPEGFLYGVDQDKEALTFSEERLSKIGTNFKTIDSNFAEVPELLKEQNIQDFDFIFFDLGVSSPQFDDPKRGFSYRLDGPLDMRMNQNQELSAKTIVNEWPVSKLIEIFYRYGEEKFAKQIAFQIDKVRHEKEISTTFELVDIIKSALPQKVLKQKGHPAKQVFQALRVAVNDELTVFEKSLLDALDMLNSDGRAVVITFQSLEDRICKSIFKEKSTLDIPEGLPVIIKEEAPFELISRKPILPSEEELNNNNRSHSAKMRILRKR